jgi:hypothetical protein
MRYTADYVRAKQLVNEYLAKNGSKRHHAIVLDGPAHHTLNCLKHFGWKSNHIHIPNNSIIDYHSIHRVHKNTYHMSMNDFLESGHTDITSVVYMDYMCSFWGNSECSPAIDIKYLFDNIRLADTTYLAITCSVRHRLKESLWFSNIQMLKAIAHIQKIAKAHGKQAILVPEFGTYKNKGIMYTLMFRIEGRS